jgi:hypothetical protein
MMLSDVLYYQDAFVRLKSRDRRRYGKIFPSADEWAMAKTINQCLEIFYKHTTLLSGTSYPMTNLFYRGFCDIKDILAKWKISDDVTIRTMSLAMSAKFEKYWKKSNIALVVASFLDPRYKNKIIQFYMRKFYGSLYQIHLHELMTFLRKMFHYYAASVSASTSSDVSDSSSTQMFMGSKNDELGLGDSRCYI